MRAVVAVALLCLSAVALASVCPNASDEVTCSGISSTECTWCVPSVPTVVVAVVVTLFVPCTSTLVLSLPCSCLCPLHGATGVLAVCLQCMALACMWVNVGECGEPGVRVTGRLWLWVVRRFRLRWQWFRISAEGHRERPQAPCPPPPALLTRGSSHSCPLHYACLDALAGARRRTCAWVRRRWRSCPSGE